jgi:hypothetical protein
MLIRYMQRGLLIKTAGCRGSKSMLKHIQIAVLVVAASTVMASQTGRTVPASLLVAASDSLVDFAFALAGASIPAGLEIRESDDGPPLRPAFNIDPKPRVPLNDLVTTFDAHRHEYRAVVMRGGVMVIRPVKGKVPFLDGPSPISQEVTVTGLMAAARRVFAALNPGLTGPVLNSMGHEGDDIPVALDGSGGRTVMDTLNQIVTQAPRRVWVVTTREEPDGQRVISFGLIEAGRSRRTQGMRRYGE